MKSIMAEAAVQARNAKIRETFDLLKCTEEWQSKNKTQRLYMMCIACDLTHPVMQGILKELGIEL